MKQTMRPVSCAVRHRPSWNAEVALARQRCGVSASQETVEAATLLRMMSTTLTERGVSEGTVRGYIHALYEGRLIGKVEGDRVRLGAPGLAWADLSAPEASPDQVAWVRAMFPASEQDDVEEDVPSLLKRLRAAGVRIWLEPDGWNLRLKPRPLALSLHHFEAIVARVDEIRAHLAAITQRVEQPHSTDGESNEPPLDRRNR